MTRRILTVALLVLVAVGAASCAGEDQTGSAAHQVSEWVENTGFGQDIGTLVADNARIPEDVTKGGMHAACGDHGGRRRHGQRRTADPTPR